MSQLQGSRGSSATAMEVQGEDIEYMAGGMTTEELGQQFVSVFTPRDFRLASCRLN